MQSDFCFCWCICGRCVAIVGRYFGKCLEGFAWFLAEDEGVGGLKNLQ